jgi:hypothetical protein
MYDVSCSGQITNTATLRSPARPQAQARVHVPAYPTRESALDNAYLKATAYGWAFRDADLPGLVMSRTECMDWPDGSPAGYLVEDIASNRVLATVIVEGKDNSWVVRATIG